jgi:WD40 repeat protein
VWNPATGKLSRTLEGFGGEVTALAIAGDGKIAAAAADQKLRVFAATATKASRTWSMNTEAVKALAWSKDGKLASGGQDAAVHLWGVDADKPLYSLEHAGGVESLAFSSSGKLLAAGAAVHRVNVWTYPGRKHVKEFTYSGSPPEVKALAWSADASLLLDGRANHNMVMWDLKQPKPRGGVDALAPVDSVSWSAGGKMMVSCTKDRSVRFWSATNGQVQFTVVAEKDHLTCIAAEGNYRTPDEEQKELVCVALTAKGMDTMAPKEFATKFGWKNTPLRAKIPTN